MKPCLKILASAVGGTKNFFNSKLYTCFVEIVSSFSSLAGHGEGGFSDTKTEVEGKWCFKLKLITKVFKGQKFTVLLKEILDSYHILIKTSFCRIPSFHLLKFFDYSKLPLHERGWSHFF